MNNPKIDIEEAQDEQELSYEDEFEELWGKQPDDGSEQDEDENEETGEQYADDETEGLGEQEAPPVAPPVAATPATTNDPYAWIKALPEEVRAQAESLKHSAMSDQGRVAAYNRQLDSLRRELEAAQRQARSPVPAEQKGQPSVSAAPELPAKFKQLKEDFPEFADAVEEMRELDRLRYEARLTEALSPLEEQRVAHQRTSFTDTVSAAAKDIFQTEESGWAWQDIVAGDDFLAWLDLQPASMKAAARAPDPVEAIAVLRRYRQDYDTAVAAMQDPATPANSSARQADDVKNRRNKRKSTSVVPGSRPVASDPKNVSGDYEDAFNAMWG
jgi:hypothetical protein